MNEDFLDALRALLEADARFLVVGAHALAVHGVPRSTGDLDIWIDRSPDNVARVWIGLPPRRIDLLTGLSGVDLDHAWVDRTPVMVGNLEVPFLGRASLITNKRATGRLKDLADLEALGEPPREGRPDRVDLPTCSSPRS